jgi:hypothetical protein
VGSKVQILQQEVASLTERSVKDKVGRDFELKRCGTLGVMIPVRGAETKSRESICLPRGLPVHRLAQLRT